MTEIVDKITIEQWDSYRRVQDSGLVNMLTPQAREMTGLEKDTYFVIIDNYSKLRNKFEGE